MFVLDERQPIAATDIATTFKVENSVTQVRMRSQELKPPLALTTTRRVVKRGRGPINGDRQGNDGETG